MKRTTISKVGFALLVGSDLLSVAWGLRRRRLPELVRQLERPARIRYRPMEPRRLGRIVHRVLCFGPGPPRCLVSSLVLFRMLRRQGTAAELVIGLPPTPVTHEAHAWVEVLGTVIGPPPGRHGHQELVRFGASVALAHDLEETFERGSQVLEAEATSEPPGGRR